MPVDVRPACVLYYRLLLPAKASTIMLILSKLAIMTLIVLLVRAHRTGTSRPVTTVTTTRWTSSSSGSGSPDIINRGVASHNTLEFQPMPVREGLWPRLFSSDVKPNPSSLGA
jgi:hypothetical protein